MMTEQTSVFGDMSIILAAPFGDHRSVRWLRNAHREQLALCRQLEEIADSLPDNISNQKCLFAAKVLHPLIKSVHDFEEKKFFPWVAEAAGAKRDLSSTLERLRFEHCEDECFAEELTDVLHRIGTGDKTVNYETAGYMLRGFFEGMRRHIAFEREHLLDQYSAA
ncbi:MAG: hypothetical protein RIR97_1914 [Pseudomonadota bacterium]